MAATANRNRTINKRALPPTPVDGWLFDLGQGTDEPWQNEDRKPFFKVAGVEYTLPRKVALGQAMRAVEAMPPATNHMAYSEFIIDKMCGPGTYEALLRAEGLEQSHLAQVIRVVTDELLGPLRVNPEATDPKGTTSPDV